MDLFQSTCFKAHCTHIHDGCKIPLDNNKLVSKICIPVISWNKKHTSKKAVSITFTSVKSFFFFFFFLLFFKVFSFVKEEKYQQYNLVYMSLLCISREEKTKQVVYMSSKFKLPYVHIQTDVPKSKNTLRLQFCSFFNNFCCTCQINSLCLIMGQFVLQFNKLSC